MAEHNGVSTVRIDRLDYMDDPVLRAYHTVLVESAAAGRSNPSLWSFEGLNGYVQNLEHPESAHYYGAYMGDQLVGVASVDISEGDEGKTQVDLNIEVLPAYRRQGVATALYRFIEQKHLKSPYLVCGDLSALWPAEHLAGGLLRSRYWGADRPRGRPDASDCRAFPHLSEPKHGCGSSRGVSTGELGRRHSGGLPSSVR